MANVSIPWPFHSDDTWGPVGFFPDCCAITILCGWPASPTWNSPITIPKSTAVSEVCSLLEDHFGEDFDWLDIVEQSNCWCYTDEDHQILAEDTTFSVCLIAGMKEALSEFSKHPPMLLAALNENQVKVVGASLISKMGFRKLKSFMGNERKTISLYYKLRTP